MKRVLMTVALAAAFVLAAGTTALAAKHAAKPYHLAVAQVAATAICDPAHCPVGSCAAAKATMTSAAASKNGAACPKGASCPASCPRQSTAAVAANVAKP